jgi:hypothetical protein
MCHFDIVRLEPLNDRTTAPAPTLLLRL